MLVAATRAPGEFILKAHPDAAHFGQVAVGMRADLLLVKNDPLQNLETVNHPLGVMADGRWFSARDLKALLEKVKQRYQHLDQLP